MGNSSTKQRFRDAVDVLHKEDVPREDAEFWDELWKMKTSTQLTFEIISPKDVRKLREEHPNNLHNLIEQAVCQICHIIQNPLPQYHDHALNCLRVLTRTLPFILECPTDPWVSETCWQSVGEGEPLGQLAIHAVMHLAFLPGFTVELDSFEDQAGDDKYAAVLDHSAINSNESSAFEVRFPKAAWANINAPCVGSQYDSNRVEVMRLLLCMLCEPLFHPAEQFSPSKSGQWSQTATRMDAPFASLLFNSLFYSIINFDTVGWGLPFGAHVSPSSSTSTAYLQKCTQLLIVLLDFGSNGEPQSVEALQAAAGQGSSVMKEEIVKPKNVFVELLRRMGSDGSGTEFRCAYNGISKLLSTVHESKNVYIPGTKYDVECYQEVLVLFWKLLEENHDFMLYIMKNCDITLVVVPICYILFSSRKDYSKVGLIHICTFILLKLSGERNFSVQLNKPFDGTIPCVEFPLFSGCHSDLIILVLHKLVVNGVDKLSPLYNCFITIIANMSPYTKSLCMASSVKLVSLFELFTSHRFLYAAEGNHVYVALLLEVMNNLVQYQYAGNAHLVYAIIRRRKVFEVLNALNLPTALQQAKQQQEHGVDQTAAAQATNVVGTYSAHTENGSAVSQEPGSSATQEGKFVPNEAWLASVKNELPLATILRLLQHVVPQVDELVRRGEGTIDDAAIVNFLSNTTMVGLLPVPHPIVIRKYTPNLFTGLWFTAFLWGVLFLENQVMPLYDASTIKLFSVSVAPSAPAAEE
jgi:hypothetical protein